MSRWVGGELHFFLSPLFLITFAIYSLFFTFFLSMHAVEGLSRTGHFRGWMGGS